MMAGCIIANQRLMSRMLTTLCFANAQNAVTFWNWPERLVSEWFWVFTENSLLALASSNGSRKPAVNVQIIIWKDFSSYENLEKKIRQTFSIKRNLSAFKGSNTSSENRSIPVSVAVHFRLAKKARAIIFLRKLLIWSCCTHKNWTFHNAESLWKLLSKTRTENFRW